MSETTRGTPFWRKPGEQIAPGDFFREVPICYLVPPIRAVKRFPYNVPSRFSQRDLYELHEVQGTDYTGTSLQEKGGEETVSRTKVGPAIFLTWGSDVDSDLAAIEQSKKVGGRVWLAAPVEDIDKLSDKKRHEQPGGLLLSDRDVVKKNANSNRFYLPPFPDDAKEHLGRYIDFKKISPVGIQVFLDSKSQRVAGLTADAINDMYHHLFWHFTRAEIFFRPITCPVCGTEVPRDTRFEGQNISEEPWDAS